MAQLVLGDGAERQGLFQERRHAYPFGVLLTDEVLVVCEGQEELPGASAQAAHPTSPGPVSCPASARSLFRRAAMRSPSL